MELSNLLSKVFSNDQYTLVQGIEKKLRSRKKNERNSIYFAIVILLSGVLSQFAGADLFRYEYYRNFASFIGLLVTNPGAAITNYDPVIEPIVFWIVVLSPLFYFMLVRSRFLSKESEEPFRYTFCVSRFEEVKGTPDTRYTLNGIDRFNLLHHDLMERLNSRIKRLSLLKLDELDPKNEKELPHYFDSIQDLQSKLIAHIQIGGAYAVREDKDNNWVIHVMPQVRIGSLLSPSVLAYPVKFPLERDKKLSAEQYNQMIERIYSSVATEVYKEIEQDVQEKIKLFPTARLRAVALFHEAEDFARSNTIDAFDRAIKLYRTALQYFEISQITPITNFIIKTPVLWRWKAKSIHQKARIQTGFVKSLLYRRIISALTGRHSNPIFEIRPLMDELIRQLEVLHGHLEVKKSRPLPSFLTFPKDSWVTHKLRMIKPSEAVFERSSQVLFDAYLVAAFGYYYLGGLSKMNDYLKKAKAVHPKFADRNPLYLITAGHNEPDLDESILLTRQAAELAPDFQIAQYLLADKAERLFKIKNEMTVSKVLSVVKEFDRVLNINPGNIAALAEQGYLWWLLGDLRAAKKKFEEGCELKSISSETFVGTLTYGLARIAAEEGRFNESYDRYHQAISAALEICTYYTEDIYFDYYGLMGPEIFNRYAEYKSKVEQHYKHKMAECGRFAQADIKDTAALASRLKDPKRPIDQYLKDRFVKVAPEKLLDEADVDTQPPPELMKGLLTTLNEVVESRKFYIAERFELVKLSDECKHLADQNPEGEKLVQLNRLLLEEAFSQEIIAHEAVAPRTVKAVLSYVLNDFGNACLGYYSRLSDESKLDEAIESFDRAIEANPENVIVHFNRHLALSWKGRVRKAIEDINLAIEKYPNQKAIVFSLAQTLFDEPAEITQIRGKLTDLKKPTGPSETSQPKGKQNQIPLDDQAHQRALQKKLDEYEAAKTLLLVTIKDFSIKNSKFSTLFETSAEDKDGAIFESKLSELNKLFSKTYISSERLDGNDLNSLKLLCRVLVATDKNTGKTPSPEIKSLFLNISNKFLAEDFDIDLILESDFNDTDPELKKRRARRIKYWIDNDHVHFFSLGWLKPEYLDDYNEVAIRYFRRASAETAALGVNNVYYLNSLGNLYYGEANYCDASENYRRAVEKSPRVAVYHSNLGLACYGMEDWQKALEAFKAAVELDDKDPNHWVNAIASAEKYGNHKDSSELLRRAIALNQNESTFLSALGKGLYEKSLWKMAAETYEALVKLDQSNPNWFNDLANSYYGLTRYPKAIENYEKAILLNPKEAVFHSNLAGALVLDKQMTRAVNSYLKAIELDPANATYYNRLGVAYHNTKDYASAVRNYEQAISMEPGISTYHSNLGLAYFEQQQLEKSVVAYQKAVTLETDNPFHFNNLANSLFGLRNYKAAAENYRKSIAIAPDVAVYHANLIAALENSRDFGQAGDAYDEALKNHEGNAGFCYDLGKALDDNQKWPWSIQAHIRATELKPKNPNYRNQLGTVYMKAPDYEKAAEQFLKAMELSPRNETYLNNLIAACDLMGVESKAHAYLQQALHLDPESPLLRDALKQMNDVTPDHVDGVIQA